MTTPKHNKHVRTAAATRASVRASTEAVRERNLAIVARILKGEKRYAIALDYKLSKNRVSNIGRAAGIDAYSRPGRACAK